MTPRYILALDQGTTSSRAVLFDETLKPLASAGRAFEQHYPQSGWVEHEPDDLFGSISEAIGEVMRKYPVAPQEINAIGIANQRETTLVWNRRTGRPVHRAIVWQCRRTAELCRQLEAEGLGDYIRKNTGLVPDPYFSATKIKWILDHHRELSPDDLLFGTVDTYLIWKLTEGKRHVTDYTNAARTMLFNIRTLDWDNVLLDRFGIPRAILPEVVPSRGNDILCNHPLFDRAPIPIRGIAGDQQAALCGQCCDAAGELKITYGTGAFLLLNTGGEFISSRHGLITTLGSGTAPGRPEYVLEGSVFMAGAIMQWLRDGLGILPDAAKAAEIAASIPDTGGVCLVPAFTGLGAPYWNAEARAAITGMTRGTTSKEIIRAAEEAIAFQCADLIDAMRRDLERPIQSVRVDGGAARDSFLLQFQADLIDCAVERPAYAETTLLGAARLASGSNTACPMDLTTFTPKMSQEVREEHLTRWRKAVQTVLKA
jgi:glycerol kinase